MSFSELLQAVKCLQKEEKLTLLHTLLNEVTPEEAEIAKYFPPGATLEVFTPFDCEEAAAVLHQMLEERKAKG
jgi:hypothetical protein